MVGVEQRATVLGAEGGGGLGCLVQRCPTGKCPGGVSPQPSVFRREGERAIDESDFHFGLVHRSDFTEVCGGRGLSLRGGWGRAQGGGGLNVFTVQAVHEQVVSDSQSSGGGRIPREAIVFIAQRVA